ncbi:MAG: pilus assembly protein PilX [Leptothrix sp. (in: b-proteobacteria)]
MTLVFSLITLAALSLAAVALIRSVDTGASILGNLGFKQDALLASDEAARQAIAWLSTKETDAAKPLHADIAADGYRASLVNNLDATGTHLDPVGTAATSLRAVVDWDNNGCGTASYPAGTWRTGGCIPSRAVTSSLANGLQARWLVMRVCAAAGDPSASGALCAQPINGSLSNSTDKSVVSYTDQQVVQSRMTQYYRVIVRTTGARNSVSTTETLVHF